MIIMGRICGFTGVSRILSWKKLDSISVFKLLIVLRSHCFVSDSRFLGAQQKYQKFCTKRFHCHFGLCTMTMLSRLQYSFAEIHVLFLRREYNIIQSLPTPPVPSSSISTLRYQSPIPPNRVASERHRMIPMKMRHELFRNVVLHLALPHQSS